MTSGGIVKVQDLERVYPNDPVAPNLLYLASSALPCHSRIVASMALSAGARFILNQDGVAYPGWYGRGWKRANETMRLLVHKAHHVFYQSCFAKLSADRFLGERAGSGEILHNAVDTDRFRPVGETVEHRNLRLLVAGTHWHAYRAATAVEALSELRREGINASLRIAGRLCWAGTHDESAAQIKALAGRFALQSAVKVTGPYSQNEAVSIFQQSDILLNLQYNDVCPRLVVEAMACGVPVVYSASGGTPELVSDEAGVGLTVPADWLSVHVPSPKEIAYGVARVAERHAEFAAAARARAVERFSLARWLERHARVIGSRSE